MSAYYNENDPATAQWLRNLIAAGHIADGHVDERDIQDVHPSDLDGYTQCHFFAGIGGWSLALRLAGWGDDAPVWTGSCPCQPFSSAGAGRGKDDSRHLWPQFRRLIRQCRPAIVFGEQIASKAGRVWLSGVCADLEALAYRAAGADLCGPSVGAYDIRQRLWFVADTSIGRLGLASGVRCERQRHQPTHREFVQASAWAGCEWIKCKDDKWRPVEPGTFPLAHGIPSRVGRLRGYGNAIKPQVGAAFIGAYLDVAADAVVRRAGAKV